MIEVYLNGNNIQLDIENDFKIEEGAGLIKNLANTSQILARYADLSSDFKAQSNQSKVKLDEIKAKRALELRAEYSGKKDRLTENMLDQLLSVDDAVLQAKADWILADRDAAKLDNLFKAAVKKSDMLNSLTYYQRQEMKTY